MVGQRPQLGAERVDPATGECIPLSDSAVARALRHYGLHPDQLLRAALVHFAEHGLAAAERAHEQATAAFFADDRLEYHHWMGICRLLDRRKVGDRPGRALRQG